MRGGHTRPVPFCPCGSELALVRIATYETHRRRLSVWKRALAAMPALALLLAPYVLRTRTDYPGLFWSATALLGFFAGWATLRAAWHYWMLRGRAGA